MHAEMGKLGLEREAHYALAERTLNREVKSLTGITEEEALLVWNAAKQAGSWRAKEAAAARHLKSDEGSAAVLN